jgi:hypothetical protein
MRDARGRAFQKPSKRSRVDPPAHQITRLREVPLLVGPRQGTNDSAVTLQSAASDALPSGERVISWENA